MLDSYALRSLADQVARLVVEYGPEQGGADVLSPLEQEVVWQAVRVLWRVEQRVRVAAARKAS